MKISLFVLWGYLLYTEIPDALQILVNINDKINVDRITKKLRDENIFLKNAIGKKQLRLSITNIDTKKIKEVLALEILKL